MYNDLRFALRTFRKNPGFTVVAMLTLALGIGANTAIFSVVHGVLLKPLPYPHPDRLVTLWEGSPRHGFEQERVSGPDFIDWRDQNRVFENMAFSFGGEDINLVHSDGVEKVTCTYVLSNLFPVLGVNPFLGRPFRSEEDQWQGNRVAIISYDLWQRHFGADPEVLGRTLTVDSYGRRDYTIVGVMPLGFRFPNQCELWLPAGWMGVRLEERRSAHWHQVIARLKAGVTVDQAQTELDLIQARIEQQHPADLVGSHVVIVPLLEQTLGRNLRLALLILWGVVACVLVIACVNVANLLLARAAGRQKEIAVRVALGASRWHVTRHLLTESVLLALFGGAFGVLLAIWILSAFIGLGTGHIPRLQEVKLEAGSLVFTLLLSLLTGIVFGLAPAWEFSKPNLNETLKDTSRSDLHRSRLRSLLVISEISVSFVLLIGAGLMAKSFIRLAQTNRGFQPDHLLTAELDFSVSGFGTWVEPTAKRPQVTLHELIERIKKQPAAQSASAVSALPMGTGSTYIQPIVIEARSPIASGEFPTASFCGITPDYFRTIGAQLLRGRMFTERDVYEAPAVVIINETMAKRYFPNEDPIGKHLALGGQKNPGKPVNPNPGKQSAWSEIVGVVADIKKLSLTAETVPDVYVPYWQWPMRRPILVVRATSNPTYIAAVIRNEVKPVNRTLPLPRIRTMDEILADSVAQPRLQTLLLSLFGTVALFLAAIGIYAVISYSVVQRTYEIGIRRALGAKADDMARLVMRQGLSLTLLGVIIGLCGALLLTRVMSSLLFEVTPTDPETFFFVSILLVTVALVACLIPSYRAAKVDPMVALRHE
jgi:putative ABC transport system permease protein